MTDYDYFPSIRFQFEGDEEQAKRSIPQARTLMQQLVRRMESSDLDALIWRVNTADGTFFELHKYGDQHIALIRALPPPPPEEQPPMIKTTKTDLAFSFDNNAGTGEFLWIGARVIADDLIEGALAAPQYSAYQDIGQTTGYSPQTYTRKYTSTGGESITYDVLLAEDYGLSQSLPEINLILVEPEWTGASLDVVAQSSAYDRNIFDEELDVAIIEESNYRYEQKIYTHELVRNDKYYYNGELQRETSTSVTIPSYYGDYVLKTPNGCMSSSPYKYQPIAHSGECDQYLLLDANGAVGLTTTIPNKIIESGKGELYLNQWNYTSGRRNITNTSSISRTNPSDGDGAQTSTEYEDAQVSMAAPDFADYLTPPTLPNPQETIILNGFYELRVTPGVEIITSYDMTGEGFTAYIVKEAEIYIKNGVDADIKTYRITFPDPPDNTWDTDRLPYVMDEIPSQSERWYQGCWLIDVKNGITIHETRPEALVRAWLI